MKTLIKKRVAIGIIAGSILMGAAQSGTATELSLAHFMPTVHTMHEKVFVPLVEEIKKKTDGQITLKIYAGGELGQGPAQQFDRAVRGVADMTFGLPAYTSNLFPRVSLLELPGVLPDSGQAVEKIWDNIDQFKRDFARVELLGLWVATPTVIGTTKKPVRSLADLKGLTIRAASTQQAEFLKAWGANAVTLPASELYSALDTGVIDGVLTGPDGIRSFRLNEVLKYITRDFPGGVGTFFLVANKDSWAKLKPEQRKAVEELMGRTVSRQGAAGYRWAADQAWNLFAKGEKKVEVITSPRFRPGSRRRP